MWCIVNNRGEFFLWFSCSVDEFDNIVWRGISWTLRNDHARWWWTKEGAMRAAHKVKALCFFTGVAVVGPDGATIIG